MGENKTKPTDLSVDEYLNRVTPDAKKQDCMALVKLMREVSGEEPVMWGNMVGFGKYHYVYESGREGEFFLIGFAARKRNISVYTTGYDDRLDQKKKQLGKVEMGKSCIYIKKLEDVKLVMLEDVLRESIRITLERYPQ